MSRDLDDFTHPLMRDSVDELAVRMKNGKDATEWVAPRLFLQKRGDSLKWKFRYSFENGEHWLTLGRYSRDRSGDDALTYDSVLDRLWRIEVLRKPFPDLHQLRRMALAALAETTGPVHRADILDRVWPILPAGNDPVWRAEDEDEGDDVHADDMTVQAYASDGGVDVEHVTTVGGAVVSDLLRGQ